jgi:DUF971 family protein
VIPSNPVAIDADRQAGTLTIAWDDGHQSVYTVSQLRWACPCATCSGEWGRPGVLASLTSLPPDELRLADVHAVGMYAIAPVWASGHDSGIYSFDYLRSLCPCDECRSGRNSAG